MNTPTKAEHIDFCNAVAAGQTQKDAYRLHVSVNSSTSDETCQEAGSRLASQYAEYIALLRSNRRDGITAAIEEEARQAIRKGLVDDFALEAVLCTIATGNMKVEEIIEGGAVLRDIKPFEQIAAIDKIYKRRGSYAPVKSAATNTKGEDVAPPIDLSAIPTYLLAALLQATQSESDAAKV